MNKYGFIRCGISSIHGELGNVQANVQAISEVVQRAEKEEVKVLIFPELSITGYTVQDMFLNTSIRQESLKGLEKLCNETRNTGVLFVIGMPIAVGGIMYNAAVVLLSGKIMGVVPKTYLPNNCEFYEKRWFSPYKGKEKSVNLLGESVPFGNIVFESSLGFTLGIEICEDLWSVIPPSLLLSLSGANIIANLSASNELIGKDEYRKELVKTQSARTHSAYLYTSAGLMESTTDIVFGGSGYIFEDGKELLSANRYEWESTLHIADVDVEYLDNERIKDKTFGDSIQNFDLSNIQKVRVNQVSNEQDEKDLRRYIEPYPFVPKRKTDCEEIFNIQTYGLARRLRHIHCKEVTIGISGGLDSTLAFLVVVNAFKKLNLDTKGIHGITMPGFGTSKRTYNNSLKLAEALGVQISLEEISIKDACIQHFKDIGHDMNNHNLVYENAQARERTQILMDKGFTIGTGDFSELGLGWCTYNGDHMSMYGVNASIPKTLVKHIILWYAEENEECRGVLKDIVDTPISPELLPLDGQGNITQKTESNLGPYEVHDFFFYNFLRRGTSGGKLLFLAEIAFKDIYTKEQLCEWYKIFINKFFGSQFKRDCVPGGPKVGSAALSPRGDLRMPADMSSEVWKI
ncbi:MAG: NAD(+) synthase [Clostridia bacterium]|nr:NAD(+) synthase [Clostridia bacterium]